MAAIPKTTSKAHVRDNWGALDLELGDEDVAKVGSIDERQREVDPGFAP